MKHNKRNWTIHYKSRSGDETYTTTYDKYKKAIECNCKGYIYKGHCWHINRVEQLVKVSK